MELPIIYKATTIGVPELSSQRKGCTEGNQLIRIDAAMPLWLLQYATRFDIQV